MGAMTSFKQSDPPLVASHRPFYGPQAQPFLAPRGVAVTDDLLVVADTGQNRVFIWRGIPTTPYHDASVVLGQSDQVQTRRNTGAEVDANTLLYPSAVWTDGSMLIVADAWNHRVLIWKELPTSNHQPADIVVGQPDFRSNQPNVEGLTASPSARSLYWPYGIYCDGRQLWIADTGNRRVLYYERIPSTHFRPADAVIGQKDFHHRDYDPAYPIWPYSLQVHPRGTMAIVDTQYYRVLVWRDWKEAFHRPADVVIGQPDLHSNGQNQFQWQPSAHTLNWCYHCCFYRSGLFVADTGNSRILWFERVPQQSNAPASRLLGQSDFHHGLEHPAHDNLQSPGYYWPFSLSISGKTLAVADTGNHRIVLHHLTF